VLFDPPAAADGRRDSARRRLTVTRLDAADRIIRRHRRRLLLETAVLWITAFAVLAIYLAGAAALIVWAARMVAG
jgi:nitrate reductase NapE component